MHTHTYTQTYIHTYIQLVKRYTRDTGKDAQTGISGHGQRCSNRYTGFLGPKG